MNKNPPLQYGYTLRLVEAFSHASRWTDREREIQANHLIYLSQLEKEGLLDTAGIDEGGFSDHQGRVVLRTSSETEARNLALADPSVAQGMMSAKMFTTKTYFGNLGGRDGD